MSSVDDRFSLYDLQVDVVGDPQEFVCAHNPGPAFRVEGERLIFLGPNFAFSQYALAALMPLLPAKQRATHPNDWITTDAEIACPDPHCGARFRITRLGQRTFRHAEVTRVPLTKTMDLKD